MPCLQHCSLVPKYHARDIYHNISLHLWILEIRLNIVFLQLSLGMCFLHSYTPEPIVHTKLTARNVLLDQQFHVKVCVLFAMNCLNFLWISVSHIHWLTNYLGSIKKILLLTFTTTQWLHAVAVFRPINYRDVSSVSSAPLIYDQFVSLHFNWLKYENLLLHKRVDGIWISYEIALSDIFFYSGLDNFLYSKSPEIKWFFVFCGIRAYERVHKRYIVPGSNRYWGPWGW